MRHYTHMNGLVLGCLLLMTVVSCTHLSDDASIEKAYSALVGQSSVDDTAAFVGYGKKVSRFLSTLPESRKLVFLSTWDSDMHRGILGVTEDGSSFSVRDGAMTYWYEAPSIRMIYFIAEGQGTHPE